MTAGSVCHRDTVGSVGILNRRTLPFVGANNAIRVFRQALSLDEVCVRRNTRTPQHRPYGVLVLLWVVLASDAHSGSVAQNSARTCITAQPRLHIFSCHLTRHH
jgi:hypothetical protein